MGLQFRVSSERLKMARFQPTTPDLEGEHLKHYATEASDIAYMILYCIYDQNFFSLHHLLQLLLSALQPSSKQYFYELILLKPNFKSEFNQLKCVQQF